MKKFYLLLLITVFFNLPSFAQEVPNKQKIVISKISATWCPNCGDDAWDNLASIIDSYDKEAVIFVVHPSHSSSLHSPYAVEFTANLPEAWGQPLFYINREKYTTNKILDKAKAKVSASTSENPLANTGIIAKFKGGLEVSTKVKFFKEGNGKYYLSLLVIEDGVIANQASRGANVSHKKTLRMAMTDSAFGEEIANGTIAKNTEYTATITKEIDPTWNTDNLEVVAIIWEKKGDVYEFVNANSVPVSFVTSLNSLEKIGVKMAISPTIIKHSATILLNLPEALDNVDLSIFNAAGQQILQIFSGNIPSGEHNYTIEKSTINSPGIYFLRMAKGGDIISQKFIID